MLITLYHLHNSRSQRIVWLLEELGCEYKLKNINGIKNVDLPDEFLPIKAPTITIDEHHSIYHLSESAAICEFLCTTHQSLVPYIESTEGIADLLFWKNYADGSFMPNLALKQTFKHIHNRTPAPLKPVTYLLKHGMDQFHLNGALHEQLNRIEAHLVSSKWLCYEGFSFTDILNWFPIMACKASLKTFPYPSINRYLKQINERPAFQRAIINGSWSQSQFEEYWF